MSKILFVHPGCFIGGGSIAALQILEMLSDENEIQVFCPSYLPDAFNLFKDSGYNCIEYDDIFGSIMWYSGGPKLLSRTFLKGFFKIFRTWKYLTKTIRKEKPDIIIVNSMVISWISVMLKFNRVECKSICFVRETGKRGLFTKLIKKFLEMFDGVTFISEYDKSFFNLKKPKAAIIRDSIHQNDYILLNKKDACRDLNLSSDFFYVLFVGGTSILKGWEIISNAILEIPIENIKLLVSGYTDPKKIIKSEKIQYLGIIKDMQSVYNASDVLVLPSTSPHQLRPVFEAGFLKKPIIISRFLETSEAVTHMLNGLEFEPKNIVELKQAIERIYNNPGLSKELAENNYRFVIKRHEFINVRTVLINFIQNL